MAMMMASQEGRFFKEYDIVLQFISDFITVDDIEKEKSIMNTLSVILDTYQEASALLDPSLSDLLSPLFTHLLNILQDKHKDHDDIPQHATTSLSLPMPMPMPTSFPFQLDIVHHDKIANVFQLIYLFCKVRGYKTIRRFFPHTVNLFELILILLQNQDPTDTITWHIGYGLLHWLSILALIPFDLTTVQSTTNDIDKNVMSVPLQVFTLCKVYLKSGARPLQTPAANCLAKIMSRPDITTDEIKEFFDWILLVLKGDDKHWTGVLLTLCELPQHMERPKLLLWMTPVLQLLLNLQTPKDTIQRKLIVKVIGRLGLSTLPPKVQSWRYKRGQRTLLNQLQTPSIAVVEEEEDDDVTVQVSAEMEAVVDVLLTALGDSDTIVRWCAAKGLGRLTARLPFALADDIVDCILQLFIPGEQDGAWHGGALALAELARRGVLLPARLPLALQGVLKALVYDQRRGAHSVGSHVRDAACYVCWAFARAYAPLVLRPYMQELAQGLLVIAVLDREINCRRAASAAFQELVGRQGHAAFPDGISLITLVDHFSVGNRTFAYLTLAPSVGKFGLYRYGLFHHLVTYQLMHWDVTIRQLSAQALRLLTPLDPTFVILNVLPIVLESSLSVDVSIRHGSILAVAEIILGLSETPCCIPGVIQKQLRNLIPKIEKGRLYRGRGGEFVRSAVCRLISVLAVSTVMIPSRLAFRLLDTVEECARSPKTQVQETAVEAYERLVVRCLLPSSSTSSKLLTKWKMKVTTKYFHHVSTESNVAFRRGYASILAVTPLEIWKDSSTLFEQLVNVFLSGITIRESVEERDPESRVAAIVGLISVFEKVVVSKKKDWISWITSDIIKSVFDALIVSCSDYSTDDRGDVGSWVRIAAMKSLTRFLPLVAQLDVTKEASVDENNTTLVTIRYFGVGTIIGYYGESPHETILVEFPKGSFGALYFGYGKGIFHTSSIEKKSDEKKNNVIQSSFLLPEMEIRRSYLTSLPTTTFVSTTKSTSSCLLSTMVHDVLSILLQQLCEKLDIIRQTSGDCLVSLIDDKIPHIPSRDRMEEIFTCDISWGIASDTYSRVLIMLEIPLFRNRVLRGLIISVGGLTESVVKCSKKALLEWFTSHYEQQQYELLNTVCLDLLHLLDEEKHNDRIAIPCLKTWGFLLNETTSTSFLYETGPDFGLSLYENVKNSIKNSTCLSKINAGITVLFGLLPNPTQLEIENKTIKGLLILLGHRYPKVRKGVAEHLYTKLLIHEELVSCDHVSLVFHR